MIPTHPQRSKQGETFIPWQHDTETTGRAVEGKGQKFAREFSKAMWKQCGARVVVMAAWKGAMGDIMYGL